MPYDILVPNYMPDCGLLNFQANNRLFFGFLPGNVRMFYHLHVTIMGLCNICTYDSICIMIYSLKITEVNRNNPLISLH